MTQSNGPRRAPLQETNLARPYIAIVDQIGEYSDLIPHLILGYEAESVSCRISNLLQSLDPPLPCLDSIIVGLRLRLSKNIFFRGYIPHATILHQARISKITIWLDRKSRLTRLIESAKIPNM